MNCFYCKGGMIAGTTTHVVDLSHCIVIVKNVPCVTCEQCGNVFYDDAVASRLEEIVASFQTRHTEIAVVNYMDLVA